MRGALFVFLLLLSTASARVVVYTAYSDESQAAADEEALAGVAKQISSTIKSSSVIRRSETERDGHSEMSKSAFVKNSLRSEIFLKGVNLSREAPKNGRFVSTASVDLDELTSLARFKIEEIQKEVKNFEKRAEEALFSRRYLEALALLEKGNAMVLPHANLLEEIAIYKPIDSSLGIEFHIDEIRHRVLNALRSVRLEWEDKIEDETFYQIFIRVKDSVGPLSNFSLRAERGGRLLGESLSDSSGKVSFRIKKSELKSKPSEVEILANVPLAFRREAGIKSLSFSYASPKKTCALRLQCKEPGYLCDELSMRFVEQFGASLESSAGSLSVKISTTSRRSLQQLSSYAVEVTFIKADERCLLKETGVGRDEHDALRNAIKKLNFDRCPSIETWCGMSSL